MAFCTADTPSHQQWCYCCLLLLLLLLLPLPLPLTLSCREIVVRRPHEFKIACLQDIRALFPAEWNPFYAAFGNRDTDEVAYRCAHCLHKHYQHMCVHACMDACVGDATKLAANTCMAWP